MNVDSKVFVALEMCYSGMQLERVLTKLRFDESVSGYALFTNEGSPFLSFSLPDEILPIIQGTMKIHAASLTLMNVMTGAGIVVLARVDANWVLGVLFLAEESLGSALQKTQDVISLMKTVELPPPPSPVEKPVEPESVTEIPPAIKEEPEITESIETKQDVSLELAPIPLEEIEIRHGCTVFKGPLYGDAMSLDSSLNQELKTRHSSGVDLCLMIDEKRTVFKMSEILGRSVEEAIDAVQWCVSRHIMTVECPEKQELGTKEIVELPLFEGELKKTKKEHRAVLELCDGNRSLQLISDMLGIQYFQALQSVVPYRGKSVKFIRKAKDVS